MREVHLDLYEREQDYWWAVIHRKAAISIWKYFSKPDACLRTLDVGCGAGAFLSILQKHAKACGIDSSLKACEFAKNKGNNIIQADIIKLPFRQGCFDAVFALDIIEHIDDAAGVLKQLYRVCSPGGLCIVTVPAWDCLWSERDVYLGHKRRYTIKRLRVAFGTAGFKFISASYMYALLFPALYARNKIRKLSGYSKIKSDVFAVPGFLNRFLINLFSLELKLLPLGLLPFGTSIICVAKKSR